MTHDQMTHQPFTDAVHVIRASRPLNTGKQIKKQPEYPKDNHPYHKSALAILNQVIDGGSFQLPHSASGNIVKQAVAISFRLTTSSLQEENAVHGSAHQVNIAINIQTPGDLVSKAVIADKNVCSTGF